MHCAGRVIYANLFHKTVKQEIMPLGRGRSRLREVLLLVQSHTASERWSWD